MSSVNLVGITKPNENYTGCTTADELIGWSARVSNPSNQANSKSAARLIRYLITRQHWSPLEIVNMAVEVKTTRDIARQMLRHVSFRFQEYSQRYADPTQDLGFVLREARLQDTKNRQNSIELTLDEKRLDDEWKVVQQQAINSAEFAYKWAISRGIAKEQARVVLPEGNTESVLIMQGTVRSFVHYVILRAIGVDGQDTQKEHRLIATDIWSIIEEHFPQVAAAVNEIIKREKLLKRLLACIEGSEDLDALETYVESTEQLKNG